MCLCIAFPVSGAGQWCVLCIFQIGQLLEIRQQQLMLVGDHCRGWAIVIFKGFYCSRFERLINLTLNRNSSLNFTLNTDVLSLHHNTWACLLDTWDSFGCCSIIHYNEYPLPSSTFLGLVREILRQAVVT